MENDLEHHEYLKKAQELVFQIANRGEAGYCPFLPQAIINNSVWYELIDNYTIEDYSTLIEKKIKQFGELHPINNNKRDKTLLLIFPKIPYQPAKEILDSIQQEL